MALVSRNFLRPSIPLAQPCMWLQKALTKVGRKGDPCTGVGGYTLSDADAYEAFNQRVEIVTSSDKEKEAMLWLSHPTSPDPQPFLELLRRLRDNPQHPMLKENNEAQHKRAVRSKCYRTEDLLRAQGREEDAEWVSRVGLSMFRALPTDIYLPKRRS